MDWIRLGFSREPFADGAAACSLWLDSARREMLAGIVSSLGRGDGLTVVTGKPGVGKTALLRCLTDEIGKQRHLYFLSETPVVSCSPAMTLHDIVDLCSFARRMARSLEDDADPEGSATGEFGGGIGGTTPGAAFAESCTAVVLLDDADLLKGELLDQLRRWRRAFHSIRGPLALVLAADSDQCADGTPMADGDRDTVVELLPFAGPDRATFLRHQIAAAGGAADAIFSPAAVNRIADYGEGCPATMNRLSREAMALAETDPLPLGADRIDDVARRLALVAQRPKDLGAAGASGADLRASQSRDAPPRGGSGRPPVGGWRGLTLHRQARYDRSRVTDTPPLWLSDRQPRSRDWTAQLEIPEPNHDRLSGWGAAAGGEERLQRRSSRPLSLLRMAPGAMTVLMALVVAAAYLVETGYIDLPQYQAFRERMTSGLTSAISMLQSKQERGDLNEEIRLHGGAPASPRLAPGGSRADDTLRGEEDLSAPTGLLTQAGSGPLMAEEDAPDGSENGVPGESGGDTAARVRGPVPGIGKIPINRAPTNPSAAASPAETVAAPSGQSDPVVESSQGEDEADPVVVAPTKPDAATGNAIAREAVTPLREDAGEEAGEDAEDEVPGRTAESRKGTRDTTSAAPTGMGRDDADEREAMQPDPTSAPEAMPGPDSPAEPGAARPSAPEAAPETAPLPVSPPSSQPGVPSAKLADPSSQPAERPALQQGREAAVLLDRGNGLLDLGDVAAARLFYRRAAERGSPEAAMLMGLTFDPVYFQRSGIRGTRPNPDRALEWYQRAIEMGSAPAEERIAALRAWLHRSAQDGDAEARRVLEQLR